MTASAAGLIGHVQETLKPQDEPSSWPWPPYGQSIQPEGSRQEPPDWLDRVNGNEPLWEDDDEIALPPAGGGEIPVDTSDVTLNPDVHAFYLPFHFYRHRWGIYIRAKSIVTLTAFLLKRQSLVGDEWDRVTARAVFRMLLEHETFHHLTELAISRLEAVAIEYMGGDSLYRRNCFLPQSVNIEEGMANSFALRALLSATEPLRYAVRSVTLGRIAAFMEQQPVGYREFEQYLKDADFLDGKDQIITEAKACSAKLGRRGGVDGVLPGRVHFIEKTRPAMCPVRLVIEPGVPVAQIKPFPKHAGMRVYVYTRHEHPPPHFHLFMPPDREHGSYGWPGLEPVGDSPRLTGKDEQSVRQYIGKHQPKIYQRIQAVYPNAEDLP